VGKFLSIFGGIAAIIISIILLFRWIMSIKIGLQFCIVAALLLGGLMAILFGIIEIKDSRELKKMEQEEKK